MNILFLTQVLPYPLDAGPKTRAYYVLKHLASAGHRVTLLSFVRKSDQPEHIEHLRTFCAQVETVPIYRSRVRNLMDLARSFIQNKPFLIVRDHVATMEKRVHEILAAQPPNAPIDVIHADQLWMASYALQKPATGSAPKRLLDQHNAVFQIPQRLASTEKNFLTKQGLLAEARRLARFEAETVQKFDQVVWVTSEDHEALKQATQIPTKPATNRVIPICIEPDAAPVQREQNAFRVTFIGGLHWPPNAEGVLWFAQEVWPLVLQREPEAVFTVIGQDPRNNLKHQLAQTPRVEVTGYVENLLPWLTQTAVFVVPLRAGGGMRVKILDAWNYGLPVVSTEIGAEGIHYTKNEDVLIEDSANSFATAIVNVLQTPSLAKKLSEGGRRALATHYDWRVIYKQWDKVYEALGH